MPIVKKCPYMLNKDRNMCIDFIKDEVYEYVNLSKGKANSYDRKNVKIKRIIISIIWGAFCYLLLTHLTDDTTRGAAILLTPPFIVYLIKTLKM